MTAPSARSRPFRWAARGAPLFLMAGVASCGPTPAPMLPKPPPATAAKDAPAKPRPPEQSPFGETAIPKEDRLMVLSQSGDERWVAPGELHPPPGDRALLGIATTAVLYLDDGRLLAGTGDGTVTWLNRDLKRTMSLGFRGAITGFVTTREGFIALTTAAGVMAVISQDGKAKWEAQLTAEALAAPQIAQDNLLVTASQRAVFVTKTSGEIVLSHASPRLFSSCERLLADCHESAVPAVTIQDREILVNGLSVKVEEGSRSPAASLTPVFPMRWKKVTSGIVISILPNGPDEVLALVKVKEIEREEIPAGTRFQEEGAELVRVARGKVKRVKLPHQTQKKEVYLDGAPAAKADVAMDTLVVGPQGEPWLLGRRVAWDKVSFGDGFFGGLLPGAGQIFEVTGSGVKERKDLFPTFASHMLRRPIATTHPAQVLCFGEETPICAVADGKEYKEIVAPAPVTSATRSGDHIWISTADGAVYRTDGKTFTAVARPEGVEIQRLGGGSKGVWADFGARYSLLQHDTSAWSEVSLPAPPGRQLSRRGEEVYTGKLRHDGRSWSIVHGAPSATAVVVTGKDDVWIGNSAGLWHGFGPGPVPLTLTAPALADEGALAAPKVMAVGPDNTRYKAEKAQWEVASGKPLTAAKSASTAADGTLWIQAWDRVVEVTGGSEGTVISDTIHPVFGRWAQPGSKGKGTILARREDRGMDQRDMVLRGPSGGFTEDDIQLDGQDLAAVHTAFGVTWVLGAPPRFAPGSTFVAADLLRRKTGLSAWQEAAAHALVREGDAEFRPVMGLPSAAWCDVAVASDGGAWLAGGLSAGPSGEGILIHARGRLGASGLVRYRAGASLLAVSAVGADEAWAAGAGGTVLHVKGSEVTRLMLPSGEWIRAVYAASPTEVWFGGDGGTLFVFDGQQLSKVNHPLGDNSSITGIVAWDKAIWAVSPAGILKIKAM